MYPILQRLNLWDDLVRIIDEDLPLFGTCAGMIRLSSGVEESDQPTLSAMDYRIIRNANGHQRDSFDMELSREKEIFSALFIRAPRIHNSGESLDVLIAHDGEFVLVCQKNCLATASLHPELTGFIGIHRYFMEEMAVS